MPSERFIRATPRASPVCRTPRISGEAPTLAPASSAASGCPAAPRAWLGLQLVRDQDPTLGAHCRAPVLTLDTATQLHNLAPQVVISLDSHHEPLQENCFISVHGSTEPDPELETHHGGLTREVRRGQAQEESSRMRATRNESTKAS